MDEYWVDISGFAGVAGPPPEQRHQALWTFSIADRTVSFWGRYTDVVSTAERFAAQQGLQSGPIALVACLTPLRASHTGN